MKEKIIGPDYNNLKSDYVSKKLSDNEDMLRSIFAKSGDVQFKKLNYEKILVVYIENIINKETIENHILTPLMSNIQSISESINTSITELKNSTFKVLNVEIANTFDILVLNLLSGSTLVFLDESDAALVIKSPDIKERALTSAESEQSIRGLRVTFGERLKTNISLIRSYIKDPNLCIEILKVGRRSQKEVAIIYISGIINEELPSSIIQRIQQIDIDGIIGAAQLEELIGKNKWTVMPQMMITERLDRTVGNLFEGRAALVIDGTSFVMIVPTTFNMLITSADDYFQRPLVSTMLRIIRYLSFIVCTSFEGAYLALTSYQPGMFPTPLALSITGSRVGLPFPIIVEVFLMEITLYVLQEAAIRLPKPLGTTVSIVGGLVIGQSVVQAGIVSPIIIVVVAGSAITSFTLPNYTFSLGCIMLRLFLVSMSAVLGLYGLVIGWIFILIHLSSLEEFGVRYLSDYSPYSFSKVKDTLIRVNESIMNKRPKNLNLDDDIKNNTNVKVDDKGDTW